MFKRFCRLLVNTKQMQRGKSSSHALLCFEHWYAKPVKRHTGTKFKAAK
jgi:hypothetical protein